MSRKEAGQKGSRRRKRPRWSRLPATVSRQLRAHFSLLERRYGTLPDDDATGELAGLACEFWWAARTASETAIETILKRRDGKGRRPSLDRVATARNQQRDALKAYADILGQLDTLCKAEASAPKTHDLSVLSDRELNWLHRIKAKLLGLPPSNVIDLPVDTPRRRPKLKAVIGRSEEENHPNGGKG